MQGAQNRFVRRGTVAARIVHAGGMRRDIRDPARTGQLSAAELADVLEAHNWFNSQLGALIGMWGDQIQKTNDYLGAMTARVAARDPSSDRTRSGKVDEDDKS